MNLAQPSLGLINLCRLCPAGLPLTGSSSTCTGFVQETRQPRATSDPSAGQKAEHRRVDSGAVGNQCPSHAGPSRTGPDGPRRSLRRSEQCLLCFSCMLVQGCSSACGALGPLTLWLRTPPALEYSLAPSAVSSQILIHLPTYPLTHPFAHPPIRTLND